MAEIELNQDVWDRLSRMAADRGEQVESLAIELLTEALESRRAISAVFGLDATKEMD